eukprot:CAMPEP_0201733616 /NCGR_PEP_ID=MMETSP0593-20130828/32068_1 /ASSEMBLY_ACC=CAM_ASM_000672 /TAXON_ID=267983 /ORGANISM="Skeletonema japonicum, Strain CCMP2506" /LENGTH=337 /DNA_ID=CAMNT_0048226813 /DNA_START=854 /DNA_END=1864 /DNA_ORIENTATION=-
MNLANDNNRYAKTAVEMKHTKQTFPFILYEVIEWASNSEFSSTLTWSPSGNEFVIYDRDLALEHITPKFFIDHNEFNNWKSFVKFEVHMMVEFLFISAVYTERPNTAAASTLLANPHQTNHLNLWGFKHNLDVDTSNTTKKGKGNSERKGETFYHQYFKRGKVEELQLMQRAELKELPTKSKEQLSNSFDTVLSHAVSSSHCGYVRFGCGSSTVAGTTSKDRNHSFKIQDINPQPQQHDFIQDQGQGSSPLAGWKLEGDSYDERSNLAPGGGSMIEACSDIMLGPGKNSTVSSETPMQHENEMPPHVLQHKLLMQNKMMMQYQMFHGYPLAPGDISW